MHVFLSTYPCFMMECLSQPCARLLRWKCWEAAGRSSLSVKDARPPTTNIMLLQGKKGTGASKSRLYESSSLLFTFFSARACAPICLFHSQGESLQRLWCFTGAWKLPYTTRVKGRGSGVCCYCSASHESFYILFAFVSSLAVLLRCSFVNQKFLSEKVDVHYII